MTFTIGSADRRSRPHPDITRREDDVLDRVSWRRNARHNLAAASKHLAKTLIRRLALTSGRQKFQRIFPTFWKCFGEQERLEMAKQTWKKANPQPAVIAAMLNVECVDRLGGVNFITQGAKTCKPAALRLLTPR